MGFLNHSTNNIVIDAVLTNKGREKIATGGLGIVTFALSDDEVDYTLIKKYGRIVGKEKIEKNTPIFEASTSAEMGLKYYLNDGGGVTGGVGQVLESFTLQLVSQAAISGTTIAYDAQNANNGTNSFQVQINKNTPATNLDIVPLDDAKYTVSVNETFLTPAVSGPTTSPFSFNINAAAKNLTQYHNINNQLVLPITVKNDNGFEQTIFVTINPFPS